MKYNKGFMGLGVVIVLIGILVVGGVVYYNTKTPTLSLDTNTNEQQNQAEQVACNSNSPRAITVISPNGGETFQLGQQISVTWNTCNPNAGDQVMIVMKSNQTPFGAEIATVSNTGSATITLPTSFGDGQVPVTAGQYYKIRLELGGNAMGQQAPQDESNGLFSINFPASNTNQQLAPNSCNYPWTQSPIFNLCYPSNLQISEFYLEEGNPNRLNQPTPNTHPAVIIELGDSSDTSIFWGYFGACPSTTFQYGVSKQACVQNYNTYIRRPGMSGGSDPSQAQLNLFGDFVQNN